MKNSEQIKVEVKEMSELNVAYVRHIGPYKGDSELFEGLFDKLMKWAGPRGLLRFPETQVLSVYHDDPKITDEDKLRTSACITVHRDTPVEGEVGKMAIPGGKFAVASFEIASDEFEDAWNMLMGGWMQAQRRLSPGCKLRRVHGYWIWDAARGWLVWRPYDGVQTSLW